MTQQDEFDPNYLILKYYYFLMFSAIGKPKVWPPAHKNYTEFSRRLLPEELSEHLSLINEIHDTYGSRR